MNATPRRLLTPTLALGLAGALHLPHAMAQYEHQDHHPQTASSAQAPETARPPAMDHGQMMEHMRLAQPGGMRPGSDTVTPAAHSIPALTDADRAAAFPDLPPQTMHAGGINSLVLAEQLEWQDADDGSALVWDINGWVGGDIDRLAFRSEGERVDGHTEEAELQLLWSHAIGPWWETVVGVRQDFKPGSPQTWAAFGVQGMPLFGLETEATAFLGEGGQSAARLAADYDILLTNRLILQPSVEVNLHGRNDPQRGVGAGLSDAELGLRLRYEINRQFAPYIGVNWSHAYGNTADLQRANGEDDHETRLVAGVRFWF